MSPSSLPGEAQSGILMEQILINLIGGAIGGAGTGKAAPAIDMGTVINAITGLVGGGVLGQLLPIILPALAGAAQGGSLDIGSIVTNLAGGGVGGAILTAVIGLIKNKMAA